MAESWESPRVIKNVTRAVERARENGIPVIWVQHESDDLVGPAKSLFELSADLTALQRAQRLNAGRPSIRTGHEFAAPDQAGRWALAHLR
jgi:nicotinamidase-related amidase